MMRTSESGREFVGRWEGFRADAYLCPAKVWTIGFGHTDGVQPGDRVTREEALALLSRDLQSAERAINETVKVELQQHEFDAIASLTFNIGAGGWRTSTCLARLNIGRKESAADALTWFNKITVNGKRVELVGLVRRRNAEKALFLTGDYGEG